MNVEMSMSFTRYVKILAGFPSLTDTVRHSMMSSLTLWLALLFLVCLSNRLVEARQCEGFLQCWLNSFEIPIPNATLVIPAKPLPGEVIISNSNLKCLNFDLDSIGSDMLPGTVAAISLGTSGLAARCEGDWSFQYGTLFSSGNVLAQLSDTSLNASAALLSSDGEFATSAHALNCSMQLNMQLSFNGTGIVSEILELLEHALSSIINQEVPKAVCFLINSEINQNLTVLLQDINANLNETVLAPAVPMPPLPASINFIGWNSTALYQVVDTLLNDVLLSDPSIVNCLIRQFLHINGTDTIVIQLPNPQNTSVVIPSMGNFTILLPTLSLSGIDTFASIQLLRATPISNNSALLRTIVALESLSVEVGIQLWVDLFANYTGKRTIFEATSVVVSLSNFSIALDSEIAVNQDAWNEMRMDQLMPDILKTGGSGLPCLLSSIFTLNFTQIDLNVSILEAGIFGRSDIAPIDSDVYNILDNVLKLPLLHFAPLVHDVVHGLFRSTVRDGLNALLTSALVNSPQCSAAPAISPFNTSIPYNFSNSRLLGLVDGLLNNFIGANGANAIFSCIGPLHISGLPSLGFGPIHAEFVEASVFNVSSFQNVTLLSPINAYSLDSQLWLGYVPRFELSEFQGPLRVRISLNVWCGTFNSTSDLSLAVSNIDLEAALDTMLDSWGFGNLTVKQFFSDGCLLAQVSSLALSRMNITLDDLDIEVDFSYFNTPSTSGNFSIHSFGSNFSQSVNSLLQSQLIPIGHAVFTELAKQLLFAAPYLCAGQPVPTTDNLSTWMLVLIVASGVAFMSLAALAIKRVFCRIKPPQLRSRQVFMPVATSSAVNSPSSSIRKSSMHHELPVYDADDEPVVQPVVWTDSLQYSDRLSPFLRFFIPVILFADIGLFLCSHLLLGAAPGLLLTLGGVLIDMGPLFKFSLGNTVHDLWFAGVYYMSILVATLSGAWPYAKILLMLMCWLMPVQLLSDQSRESVLMFLDRYGKWALIDAFMLAMFQVAFRVHINMLGDALAIDVLVDSELGFYFFLGATMLSLSMGHLVLACHRHASAASIVLPGGPTQALSHHAFVLGTVELGDATNVDELQNWKLVTPQREADGSVTYLYAGHAYRSDFDPLQDARSSLVLRARCSHVGRVVTTVLLLLSLGLLVWGSTADTCGFHIKGLAGLILGDQSTKFYSVVSLGLALPHTTRDPGSLGIKWIQLVYFCFALVIPIAFLLIALYMFHARLTLQSLRRWFVLSEVANAWAASDVFVLAIVSALLQISTFAQFLVGNKCDLINAIAAGFFAPYLDGDDVCLDVTAELCRGSAILFVSAVVYFCIGRVLTVMTHRSLYERSQQQSLLKSEESPAVCTGVRWLKVLHALDACGMLSLSVTLDDEDVSAAT